MQISLASFASTLVRRTGIISVHQSITRKIRRTNRSQVQSMPSSLHKPQDGLTDGTHHLCVLVHGLWGNASHLDYLVKALREKYSEDEMIVLACKRNASSFTYDGIDVGAERVTREIEETLEELKRDGYTIDRFSIVGYSLGGLIARYIIGILDSKKYFEYLKPVNFTTFASPHLGVRTPLTGYKNWIWNGLGARTLSASGRQLFTVDKFRDTGRPLLSVLADPDSIFVHALSKFQHRRLYTNIINDRTAVYYTTGISRIDPYTDLEKVKLKYVPGYNDVVLDPHEPYQLVVPKELPVFSERIKGSSQKLLQRIPIMLGMSLLVPVFVVIYLGAAGIQTFRSRKRILMHEQDTTENGFQRYRGISWMVQNMRAGIEDVFEATNSAHQQEYLPDGAEELADGDYESETNSTISATPKPEKRPAARLRRVSTNKESISGFPTLALTQDQFAMIRALDDVGIEKYGVHIHNSTHSHAALIVRSNRKAFDEGKMVVQHWLDGFSLE